ncbi:AP2 sigma adaptin [Giardia duodenalis]|uniref:AP complex subunit sigma n=3 Tax=Giardia intestinalis TaxID=5741 RepID=E2RTT5_GIAIC|nr:AP2 sigma adaptin [Giardia intestinalis]AAL82726.1 putative adaptor protein complex small chain subunit [Giardia intestinalis]KAE8304659.1 AP2 sigma adaptin [Giardia intestinalis]|eukprot:XP_001705823.1 Sigma adaptin [Giardia lamblia ATCC 50803]
MIRFLLIQNKLGRTRLAKYFVHYDADQRHQLEKEVHRLVIGRNVKQTNFIEFRSHKIIYRRYAGLYFTICCDLNDNELAMLEAIHLFVETLNTYFETVCELNLIFDFHKVNLICDEVFLAGEIQETSKEVIINHVSQIDKF